MTLALSLAHSLSLSLPLYFFILSLSLSLCLSLSLSLPLPPPDWDEGTVASGIPTREDLIENFHYVQHHSIFRQAQEASRSSPYPAKQQSCAEGAFVGCWVTLKPSPELEAEKLKP